MRRLDAKLYFEQDMVGADLHRLAGGLAAIYSRRSPDKDTPNEDAAAVIPYDDVSGVLVVADGMGGVPAGERASSRAVGELKASVEFAARQGLMLRTAIITGFENANTRVQDLGVGAASTLAVVEIQKDTIRPYHTGDSTILIVGQRGKIKLQTISHSPVGYAVEAGVIDSVEAMHHEDRHVVSNVLGNSEMRIELGPVLKLALRDTLLLATDGVVDNLYTNEIAERLRKGPLAQAIQQLGADSQYRMRQPAEGAPSKPDDLTFVAFRRQLMKGESL